MPKSLLIETLILVVFIAAAIVLVVLTPVGYISLVMAAVGLWEVGQDWATWWHFKTR